jgi:hypothetical protein
MLDFIMEIYLMDGNGPYVWFSLLFFVLVTSINIIFPIWRLRLLNKERTEGSKDASAP